MTAATRSDVVEGEPDLDTRCRALVADLGPGAAKDVTSVTPLTGGVASAIAHVVLHGTSYCARFALARLRVAQDWRAPVHRRRAEYAWLSQAGNIVPGIAPKVVGYSNRLQGFLMEGIANPDVHLWNAAMLSGASTGAEAASVAVAVAVGQIHAGGAAPGFDRAPSHNAADFRAIRTDPYLRATATHHPDLAPRLLHLADAIDTATTTLVLGDVSPKNILIRRGAPVLLEADCATLGDPAFDVAFCVNHLAIKAAHLPASRASLYRDSAYHLGLEKRSLKTDGACANPARQRHSARPARPAGAPSSRPGRASLRMSRSRTSPPALARGS